MWQCVKCGEQHEETFESCWNCGTAQDGAEDPTFRPADAGQIPAASEPPEEMPDERSPIGFSEPSERRLGTDQIIITTTPSVDGRRITRYCGLVAGEAVLQANTFRHFLASLTDIVRQRSTAYESELRTARGVALAQLEHEALRLGANAVVGVHLDYEAVGDEESMLMVSVSGTAVVIE